MKDSMNAGNHAGMVLALLAAVLSACGGGGGGGGANPSAPASPTALVITSTTTNEVTLSWADNADTEQGFKVERSADNGSYSVLATLPADTVSYADSTTTSNTNYSYRVKAFNAGGDSSASNVADTSTHVSAAVASMLSAAINGMLGNEVQGSSTTTVLSHNVTSYLLGAVFCMPGDPYAAPAATATPPNTLYGCVNALTVTLTPSTSSIAITLSAPTVYIDGAITITGPTVNLTNSPIYMVATNAVITITAELSTTSDGRKKIGAVTVTSLSYDALNIYAQNSLLDFVLPTIASTSASSIDANVSNSVAALATVAIATLPSYVP